MRLRHTEWEIEIDFWRMLLRSGVWLLLFWFSNTIIDTSKDWAGCSKIETTLSDWVAVRLCGCYRHYSNSSVSFLKGEEFSREEILFWFTLWLIEKVHHAAAWNIYFIQFSSNSVIISEEKYLNTETQMRKVNKWHKLRCLVHFTPPLYLWSVITQPVGSSASF